MSETRRAVSDGRSAARAPRRLRRKQGRGAADPALRGLDPPRSWRSQGAVPRALIRRDFLITRSYRLTFVLDAFAGVIYLSTYYFISKIFDGVPTSSLQGAPSYFAFAAVGAALAAVIDSVTTAITFRLREEQLTGTLEMLVVQPIRSSEICLGFVGFPFIFGGFRAALYLIVAGIWMDLDVAKVDWIGVVVMFLLSGAALATIGIASGALVLLFKRGATLVGLGLYALTLLSGSVFPISTLPDSLELIAKASPLRLAFDGVRSALFQGGGWERDALWLLLFGIAGIPVALYLFEASLQHTKRRATLGQY
jgi:ABC-2 type transport system permease protein